MTFLKKLASVILNVSGIVAGFGPVAQQLFPAAAGAVGTIMDRFQGIVDVVVQAEVIGQSAGLTGAQKAAAVAAPIAQILLDYCRVKGYKVDDAGKAKILSAAQVIGGQVADVLNAIHPDSVDDATLKIKS